MVSPTDVKVYVEQLKPEVFGFENINSVEINQLPQGLWNFNYVVKINGEKFVFKIYSPNIPELLFGNKGKDESVALNVIKDLQIAPEPIHFEYSHLLEKEVLIYRFVEGSQLLSFSNSVIEVVAKNLAKLHALDISKIEDLPRKKETMHTLITDIISTFEKCNKLNIDKNELNLFRNFVEKAKKYVDSESEIEHPSVLVHGDLAPCNIIVENDTLKIIDWQRPTLTDPAFDVWAFVEDAFVRWDLPEALSEGQKKLFIETYSSLVNDPTILERVKKKSSLYYLNVGLYCLMRYTEYESGQISPERTKGKEHLWKKYNIVKDVCVEKLKERSTFKVPAVTN
ncbi:phosphotransferase [Candidatus Woesearchaeota archaeon]|nr:phosphotransferase [Candidatus Woesearchaeota archaeon]